MKSKGIILIVVVLVCLIGFLSAYVVDETEQAVVTQFGKVVGQPKTAPGLYFKIPFIRAHYPDGPIARGHPVEPFAAAPRDLGHDDPS